MYTKLSLVSQFHIAISRNTAVKPGYAPILPGPEGDGVSNDWCITKCYLVYDSRSILALLQLRYIFKYKNFYNFGMFVEVQGTKQTFTYTLYVALSQDIRL